MPIRNIIQLIFWLLTGYAWKAMGFTSSGPSRRGSHADSAGGFLLD